LQQFGGLGKSVRGIEQHLIAFIFILRSMAKRRWVATYWANTF